MIPVATLNELATAIHQQNVDVGWWDEWPNKQDRHETAMALVFSELSEALEGWRKDLMDDHLPDLKMFHVELADTVIRLLDLVGAYDELVLDEDVEENMFEGLGESDFHKRTFPEQIYRIVYTTTVVAHMHGSNGNGITSCLYATMYVAELHNVDLLEIVRRKDAYNRKRADHKRENRSKKHGKKI